MEWLPMDPILLLIIFSILIVIAFDFTNGMHDASNMIATLVASRAMTPVQSLLLVGGFTFLGPILGGTAVADTIGGFVDLGSLKALDSVTLVSCGMLAAIAWNLLTWRVGLPSSSSHALVGGLIGAVLMGASASDISWGLVELGQGRLVGVSKILLTLLTSPLIGFIAGFVLHKLMRFMLRAAKPSANQTLRRAQWVTAAALAFAHGTNDAQKGMGIITLMLVLGGMLGEFAVPFWVIVVSATSITVGTLLGGWRIVRTVGFGIYKLGPLHGFDAQLASSTVIFGASLFGGPVSTTHVVSTAIMGVGASEHPRAVRWSKAEEILIAWVATIPCTALFGVAIYGLFTLVRPLI
ncbi:inorganic phosphate transporter [Shewanella sp. AS16]|uniref:inorganic phosphate transporter n=1 Tax=Shewanella sp. AS16 TaxID=2907625 RepID=UPI001F3527F2|nr:inorganic phosphate transporter [Shewanella sp. AS16]MCE9685135.1 inorganic phosphate transporter [Shewanella sp. AS16]